MIIDCISDLHGYYPNLEGGDLLILAGDYTASDKLSQWVKFYQWLAEQNYKKKIIISGNHDTHMYLGYPNTQSEVESLKEIIEFLDVDINFEYLYDSGTEFQGLKIWGSPWTQRFPGMNPHCMAFTCETDADLGIKFAFIPDDVDILITHSPALGVLDESKRKVRCGSQALHSILAYRIRPKLHVFGHIHEGYGQKEQFNKCLSVNASYVDGDYEPVNKPIRVIL